MNYTTYLINVFHVTGRRKSREFEDINFRNSLSEKDAMTASSNLTAFVSFGRHKAAIVRNDVIKRAMSDQKLNTLKDLKIYQVSTWHTP